MNTTLDLSELDERIGQLFVAGMPGPSLDEGTESLIREGNLGGVILFARNIQDPLQLADLCRGLQERAMDCRGLPLFLAVDQEGGRVARLRRPFTEFPGNAAIGADAEPEQRAVEFARTTALEMGVVGLNMDLAPVLDVQRGTLEKHLSGRSFGEAPELVALLGTRVIRTLQENGVMAVAKHFPGLGRATLDPHVSLPRIDLDEEELEAVNLPPFRAAIEAGVAGIMSSHALYPILDAERPATLSSPVLTGLLRERMAFQGILITDDLEMGAIAGNRTAAQGAVEAFEAGADILLICANQEEVRAGIVAIRGKLLRGEIPFRRLTEAHGRIMKAKAGFLAGKGEISLGRVKDYFRLVG
ncbi:MAG: beta-N-acetylhexosaminidase [Deltaproteobacteria bacterium]|nr:beta-N-acetylhexosaminidase [Deltaproteobacteria bacterium]